MSRIFDALRKAQSAPSEPVPPRPAPSPPPSPLATAVGRSAPAVPRSERAAGARSGYPLAVSVELDDDVVQQMTTLRLGLEAFLPDRARRAVLFQGCQGGEGATTIAHQFAWTLARDRSLRTLLMDVHAARPTLELDPAHRIAVSRAAAPGARSGPEAGVAINLHGLPAPEEARRAGMFAPATARELLDSVSGDHDWIVLDGAPILGSPDAPTLAAVADAVVLVLQAGRTKRPVVARAVDLVRKAGGSLAGTVLNRRQHEIPEFIYRRL
jgi:Mrp family chromosome partitioning ATPase